MDVKELLTGLSKIVNEGISLKVAVESFLKYKETRNPKTTWNYYNQHIKKIVDYLQTQLGVHNTDDLRHHHLDMFVASRKSDGLKNNSVNKHLECLRACLNFCVETSLISMSPMEKYKNLPNDDVETVTIDRRLMIKILDYVDALPEHKLDNLRLKYCVYMLMETGIRNSELLNLKPSNFVTKDNIITLTHTKTRRHRKVFITEKTMKYYHLLINKLNIQDDEYIMINKTDRQKISRNYIYKIFSKMKKDLQIDKSTSVSPHKFRHTYATMLVESGMSLAYVQRLLGHTNLSTTQKYLHVSTKKIHEDFSKHNPMNYFKKKLKS